MSTEFVVREIGMPVTHVKPDWFCTEASNIGLPPGLWPQVIVLDSVRFTRVGAPMTDSDGDVMLTKYRADDEKTDLDVFND